LNGPTGPPDAAISTMSPAVLACRGLAPVRDSVLRWLAERAGPSGVEPGGVRELR
jgi:hypothetical protein